jgi:oligoribonuclease
MSTPYEQTHLIWIDLETTGLDPVKDQILEVGCVITKSDLSEIGRFAAPVRPVEPLTLSLFVAEMHAKNDLLLDIGKADPIGRVDQALARWIVETMPEGASKKGTLLIAGNTPQFDKAFIAQHMPVTSLFFNHRVFDVSTLKAAMRMWFSPGWCEQGEAPHRVLADIDGAIAAAHAMRAHLLHPPIVVATPDPPMFLPPYDYDTGGGPRVQ